ncbi:MAG: DUF389 domain-containing protein [Chloroflexota bacterium]|nr:DUF389 domain-containing protein [Chloroflexota bacterium]
MHHSFQVTVRPGHTDDFLAGLDEIDEVISVAVQRGASHKPIGDLVWVHTLNRGADRVLELVELARAHGGVSASSSVVDSVIDPAQARDVAADIDETIWEDAETQLRHHSQLTSNFLLTMAMGGAIASCALLLTTTTQATAMVAAAVIAPGFEPLAKLPLAIVLGRWQLFRRGLRSALAGYVVLAAAAAATMLALSAGGWELPQKLVENHAFSEIADPTSLTLVISAAGAVAGAVMIAAQRVALLPGPLIAMQLIPAAAMSGASLAVGKTHAALEALARLGIDVALVVGAGILIFGYKQARVHRRAPVV